MNTAPLPNETSLLHGLDEALADALAYDGRIADPYARWHRFMINALIDNGVVASVAQFLTERDTPVWSPKPR